MYSYDQNDHKTEDKISQFANILTGKRKTCSNGTWKVKNTVTYIM